MEYFKEPELDPDQLMLSLEESAVQPNSDIPMTSPFIPYQSHLEGLPTYEPGPKEQPSMPWQEFLSQGSTPASKRAASPTSEVSTLKYYQDLAEKSVPVTPTHSALHTLSTSILDTNYRHTIKLPFGSTPVPAIAELPET